MHIGWPEGIWFGFAVLRLISSAALDGKPKTGEHNYAVAFTDTLLAFGLLYWGGFFS